MPENATSVTLVAFPMWTVWVVIAVHIAFIILLGLVVFKCLGIFNEIQTTIKQTREEVLGQVMPEVNATLKNVNSISTDAARTTHNVTTAADKVAGVVGAVAGRMESPAVRAAGLISGIVAGARAAKKRGEEPASKKGGKRGLFG